LEPLGAREVRVGDEHASQRWRRAPPSPMATALVRQASGELSSLLTTVAGGAVITVGVNVCGGRSIELVYPPQVTPVRLMVLEAINSVGTALAEKDVRRKPVYDSDRDDSRRRLLGKETFMDAAKVIDAGNAGENLRPVGRVVPGGRMGLRCHSGCPSWDRSAALLLEALWAPKSRSVPRPRGGQTE